MDKIILIGAVIFGIGLIIAVLNTKWKWQFGRYPFVNKSKGIAFLSWVIIIIGLCIVILRAVNEGYIGN